MLLIGIGVVQAVAALHDGTAFRRDVGSWWAFGIVRATEGNFGSGRMAEGLDGVGSVGGSEVGVIFGANSASKGVAGCAMALRLRIEITRTWPPEMVLAFHAVFVDASVVQDVSIEGVSIDNILYYLLAVRVSHQRLLDVW